MVAKECYGRVLYMTSKDVIPGQELLIYYGNKYMTELLKLDLNLYYDIPKRILDRGLDLNNKTHRWSIEKAGFKAYQVKELSSAWLSSFLKG